MNLTSLRSVRLRTLDPSFPFVTLSQHLHTCIKHVILRQHFRSGIKSPFNCFSITLERRTGTLHYSTRRLYSLE